VARELRLGVVVEGGYDAAVFAALMPRLVPGAAVVPRVAHGRTALLSGLAAFLHSLEYQVWPPCHRALVIRDANGHDAARIEREMSARLGNRTFRFAAGVMFHAVVRETETWLLAGAATAQTLAGSRDRRSTIAAADPLEEVDQAKERFQRLLSAAGLLYTPSVCAEVAATMDLDTLRLRCPGFLAFEGKLRAGG
jgi:hypothetical protein